MGSFLIQKEFPEFCIIKYIGVRKMRYDQYFELICKSMPEDWNYDDDVGIYLYKDDIDIVIENDIRWLENTDDTCYEEWASKFHNHHAYRKRFILMYRDKVIKHFYGVFVNGCRCFIPLPDANMKITKEQYGVAKIINSFILSNEEFDSYLKQANIITE